MDDAMTAAADLRAAIADVREVLGRDARPPPATTNNRTVLALITPDEAVQLTLTRARQSARHHQGPTT